MHVPVLLKEVLQLLLIPSLRSLRQPGNGAAGACWILDATFGGGGYTTAILKEFPEAKVVAVDRDSEAIQRASALEKEEPFRGRIYPFQGRFSDLTSPRFQAFSPTPTFAAALFDIGVSSFQLDTPSRGFSFQKPGPLDMRMGPEGLTADTVVNTYSEQKLADLLFRYGEEHHSRRVAAAIVRYRERRRIADTTELADIVSSVFPRKPHDPEKSRTHPATKTFQALRIFVNKELEELQYGLNAAEHLLAPGGVLGVVTFHSLEDRITKHFFRECSAPKTRPASFELLSKAVTAPSKEEIARNPRSRSAKMRAAVRTPSEPISSHFLFE